MDYLKNISANYENNYSIITDQLLLNFNYFL